MIAILEDIKKAIVEEGRKSNQTSETSRVPFVGETSEHLKPEPFRFYQTETSGLTWVKFFKVALILAAIACAAIFLSRGIYSYHQTVDRLSASEEARIVLEQSVVHMQENIRGQRDEIQKLSMEVEHVRAKTSDIDMMRDEYLSALQNIKTGYDAKIAELQTMFQEHQKLIEFLQNQIQMLSALVGVGGEVEKKQAPVKEVSFEKGISGEIVQVDTGFRFVIVTLGQNQGVKTGDSFQLYQNNKPIGRARVDRVYPSLSAATILSENTLHKVQKGDQVRLGVF